MTVLISPIGWDYDRVMVPIREYRPEKVYLILGKIDHERDRKTEKYAHKIEQDVKRVFNIPIEIRKVPILEYEEIYATFLEIIMKEKDSKILFNISSGPKTLSTIAAIVASIGKHEMIYVVPEEESYEAKGVKEMIKIPHLPLEPLSKVQKEVLKAIKRLGGRAESLGELARGIDPVVFGLSEKSEGYINNVKPRLSYYVKRLAEMGVISLREEKQRLIVEITKLGERLIDVD